MIAATLHLSPREQDELTVEELESAVEWIERMSEKGSDRDA